MKMLGRTAVCALMRCGIAWSMLAMGLVGHGSADELVFARGGKVRLAAEVRGDLVLLDTPGGALSFARSDFREIRAEEWPEREWPARLARSRDAKVDEKIELAKWALGQGMVRESAMLFREVHQRDPEQKAAASVVDMLAKLDRELKEPDTSEIRRALGADFQTAKSTHLVLFHQHGAREALERLDHLESVFTGFYLDFLIRGFSLRVPEERLVFVWFKEGDDYRAFLAREGAGAFLDTHGYYHPTRKIVVAYDARSDDEPFAKREALVRQADALAAAGHRVEAAPAGARIAITRLDGTRKSFPRDKAALELDAFQRDLQRQRLLLDMEWLEVDLPIAAHELVHELVEASGLAARYSDFPTWLNEGLAMQFESLRGGHWGGLANPSVLRLRDWNALKSTSTLASLLRDEGLSRGYDREAYANAWSFVNYVSQRRPECWIAILDALRVPNSRERDPRRIAREVLISASKQDLHAWELAWRAHARPASLEREPAG